MTKVLYGGDESERNAWCKALRAANPALDLIETPGDADPAEIDLLLYEPTGPITDFTPYRRLAGIQSLWAGVDSILAGDTLPKTIPLMRMIEDGLTRGMTEYVLGHVLRLHLQMGRFESAQRDQRWEQGGPPLASRRHIGILGLGTLGRDAASALTQIGFGVSGWSRSRKDLPNITSFAGLAELPAFLATSEILVILAPHTPETENLINTERLSLLPKGAHVINVARGALIDDDALLSGLNSGHLGSATLDVFREEPLPARHPYWNHPLVTITPHIASVTRIETAAKVVVDQVARFEDGKSFLYLVDRERGY